MNKIYVRSFFFLAQKNAIYEDIAPEFCTRQTGQTDEKKLGTQKD